MNNGITHVVLDFGGVIAPVRLEGCLERFRALGFKDVDKYINLVRQKGFFGDFESGKIDTRQLSEIVSREAGRPISEEQCSDAIFGFIDIARVDVFERNIEALRRLRNEGYALSLLSNTNPFIADWFRSDRFDGHGHPLSDYISHFYLSYELKVMKPDEEIFRIMLDGEGVEAQHVLYVDDGASNLATASRLGMRTLLASPTTDWTTEIWRILE